MKLTDKALFMAMLHTVWTVCRDPLDEERQRTYWWVLQDRCTLEEFEVACREVLATHTFHCMPLPGAFVAAVHALRVARKAQEEARQHALREAEWHTAHASHQRLLANPEDAGADTPAMRPGMEEVSRLLGAHWRTFADLDQAGKRRTRQRRHVYALPHNEREDL